MGHIPEVIFFLLNLPNLQNLRGGSDYFTLPKSFLIKEIAIYHIFVFFG